MPEFLMDIAPSSGAAAGMLAAAVIFFFATAGVAYIAFRMLRRTIRTAVRMAVVAGILVVALVGGVAIYFYGSKSSPRPKPPVSRTR